MTSPRTAPPAAQDRLAALESLDDLIICLDPELRVVTWNRAAERMLGRGAGAVIGAALMTLVAPERRPDIRPLLERALRGETVARHDTALMRTDGEATPVSLAIAPVVDGAGRTSGLLLLGHDEARIQRLQLQLLHSRRMESTGQLAGGVAHEFNNVLTAILALAEFAGRALPTDSPGRDDIRQIRDEAMKGARLVRHLLAFSRRELQRREVVQLGAIMQELEPLLQRFVGEHVLIATDASADTRPVEIDRAQLELVLLDLVSNATAAMNGGGTLRIAIRPTTVGEHPRLRPGDYVQVTFDDTVGDDRDSRPRLADRFFAAQGDDRTGFGLEMVESIMQEHGGSVGMDSAPDGSTTVILLLPAVAAAPVVPAEPLPAATSEASETILVVEDETAVRNVICRSLRDRGYEVLEAKNGEDALLVAERHNAPIHLVVTDVVMPEMGGADLFHHLRRWYPRMRILFISGYTRGAIPPEALEEGMNAAFLAKPFTLEQLLAEVRKMIHAPRSDGRAAS